MRSGHAVTLLPELAGGHADPTLALRDVAEGPLSRTVFTAVRAAAARRPALQAVRAALRNAVARAPLAPALSGPAAS